MNTEISIYRNEFFNGEFEFINSGYCTGEYNMQFDFNRTIEVSKGSALPMFRLYGWKPWAISLGANQSENDIDKDECARNGIDIVRRPTGGRAVLHADELTYSVVLNIDSNKNAHDYYRDIHLLLLKAFQNFGCCELDFQRTQSDFRKVYRQEELSVSCFTSSARYEISFKGRKIVGSAQRLFSRTLLQHGSILLGPGHLRLASLLKTDSEKKRNALFDYTKFHSATLEEACGRKISFEEGAEAIKGVLCQ
jgi:lipoate-protein ligase A